VLVEISRKSGLMAQGLAEIVVALDAVHCLHGSRFTFFTCFFLVLREVFLLVAGHLFIDDKAPAPSAGINAGRDANLMAAVFKIIVILHGASVREVSA
jgi:hypothetical protein